MAADSMAGMPVSVSDCYPIELHYIKALFVQGQYRQCIQACRDVVKLAGGSLEDHPLHKTFISLYLGLAHDEVARMMHHNSVAKMPAFNAAEQHYLDALEALPSPNEAAAMVYMRKLDVMARDQPSEDDTESNFPQSPSIAAHDSMDLSFLRSSSPTFFSPPRSRNSLAVVSPTGSIGASTSDFDDLESHDSFSQLLTPQRLQRDFSKMSLLDETVAQKQGLPREMSRMSLIAQPSPGRPKSKGMSQGLMRQIRPGDTPKQYYVPPKLPFSGTHAHLRSKLPQMTMRSKTEPIIETSEPSDPVSPRPPSPVSPLAQAEIEYDLSEASTISAPSPRTPDRSPRLGSSIYMTAKENFSDAAATYRIQDHLRAMAEQLRTHIDQVQKSKEQLLRTQAEKRTFRRMPTTGTPLAPIKGDHDPLSSPLQPTTTPAKTSGIPKSRSYWSFVPQDVKAAEKQKRIESGRERKWERKRFDPTKYRELCEKALGEL